MTFSEMKQAVYDLLGLTSETTMVARFVNEAKDELVTAHNWWWKESSVTHLITSTTRAYTLGTDVAFIAEWTNSDSSPAFEVPRMLYTDLYRRDTTTGSYPKVYTIDGSATTGACKVNVWPVPSAGSTATIRYHRRVPDVSLDTDSFQHMPVDFHFAVVQGAAARFREFENQNEEAAAMRSTFQATIDRLWGVENAKENIV